MDKIGTGEIKEIIKFEEYRTIFSLFREAESLLKEFELIDNNGIVFPVVNELRYAGNHLLCALHCETYDEIVSNLYEARHHCQRAIYDAILIIIAYYLTKIKNFQNSYRLVKFSEVIPNYPEILIEIKEIQDFFSCTKRDDVLKELDQARRFQK